MYINFIRVRVTIPCLKHIVLYCIVLYCIVLYCIVLYCIVLYCIVLYCIVLYRASVIDFRSARQCNTRERQQAANYDLSHLLDIKMTVSCPGDFVTKVKQIKSQSDLI